QPFHKEYTQLTVNQAFEKLLGLRTDVERALEKALGKNAASPVLQAATKPPVKAEAPALGKPLVPKTETAEKADAAGPLDFESCMEKIWEQLIAAPPSRGRSMTTIRLGSARVLMSSWEVAAFVAEDGFAAEDLRRAVVARALVTVATETAKETGN